MTETPEVIRSASQLRGRKITDFPIRKEPTEVLLCPPTYFDVIDTKNPHMVGHQGKVDRKRARTQWESVKAAIEEAGYKVHVIEPIPDREDMVFAANTVIIGKNLQEEKIALLSNMKHPSRKLEVMAYEHWYAARGYRIARLSNPRWTFESQGDALWHPNRQLLWGGHGFRTEPEAYEDVSKIFQSTVAILKLHDEDFYHLDTCLCPLSEEAALLYPGAFTAEGVEIISSLFADVIEVPEIEARQGFAANAFVMNRHVFIQKGNSVTSQELKRRGFDVIELDTSEFIKSGGSVMCLTALSYREIP